MFENRVQISRLSGVDGLVCDAGNLELDALVNWKPKKHTYPVDKINVNRNPHG